MFIPIFIAIFLGLLSPSNTGSSGQNDNGSVVITQGVPGDPGTPGEPGGGGNGDGTGGEGSQLPPPKP